MCCSVLQCVAVCCSVLQCVAVCTLAGHGCTARRRICIYIYGVATISRLLKITGLFTKEPYKRDDILQKRHLILRSLLIVATPYVCFCTTEL